MSLFSKNGDTGHEALGAENVNNETLIAACTRDCLLKRVTKKCISFPIFSSVWRVYDDLRLRFSFVGAVCLLTEENGKTDEFIES